MCGCLLGSCSVMKVGRVEWSSTLAKPQIAPDLAAHLMWFFRKSPIGTSGRSCFSITA